MNKVNINRLLDQDFQYSYKSFYYQTKSKLITDGIKVSLNVELDLVRGLQVLRKETNNEISKISVSSINHLLSLTLFNLVNFRKETKSVEQVDYFVKNFIKPNKIPIFSSDEELEIQIWADKSNVLTFYLKTLNDLVGNVTSSELNKILEDVFKLKKINLKVKVLNESLQRKEFEDFFFEDEKFPKIIKDCFFLKIYNKQLSDLQKLNLLKEIFEINSDNFDFFNEQEVRSADKVFSFFSYCNFMFNLDEICDNLIIISKNSVNKRNTYDHILTLINEDSCLCFQRPE